MGKKRASAASAAAAPVFPFPEAAAAGEPDHFSDYGFDPQLVGFFAQPEAKRPLWSRRHHQSPPLVSARFKLQKPISKRHHHQHLQKQQQQQRRRRWWSSAASAALLLFRRPCSSSSSPAPAAAPAPPPYGSVASASVPLYLADDCDAGAAACACWAPAVLSGRLAAAELGASAAVVPYVSLRSASLGSGGAAREADGGGALAMPIYLVT